MDVHGMLGLLLTVLLIVEHSDALRFFIKTNSKRCFKEEIHKGIVVTGEYELSDAPGQIASLHVTDTRGHTVYKREDFAETTGKLAFTADEYDIFEICMEAKSPQGMQGTDREVTLTLKHGVEAKSYDELAKAENLKPLEVEMRRLEDLSESIVNDFAYMRKREEEMRDTNDVPLFPIFVWTYGDINMSSVVAVGLIVHIVYLMAILDIYYRSPIPEDCDHGQVNPENHNFRGPANRLILFSADGLRASSFYSRHDNGSARAPFLSSLIEQGVARWGISHTRVPTESRPGHVAMIAGLYEDVSAVTRGWQDNPVDFDSVFNQSALTLAWGSPDIVDMFTKRSHNVKSHTYSASEEDFASQDPSLLDTWVFGRVQAVLSSINQAGFVKESVKDSSEWRKTEHGTLDPQEALDAVKQFNGLDLSQSGLVLFLHLLGLDTSGHGNKPGSAIYAENLKTVDDGVRQVYDTVLSTFDDNRTVFIFTSDHGMTDWGSHGAGLAHETETPFLVWGAGIELVRDVTIGRKVGRLDSLPDYVKAFLPNAKTGKVLPNFVSLEQADIAPLMSALIGASIPIHSVGKLPHSLLDAKFGSVHPYAYRFDVIFANWNQLATMLNCKRVSVHRTSLVQSIFREFTKLNTSGVNKYRNKLLQLKHESKFEEGIELASSQLDLLLEGFKYYHTYDRPFLISIIVIGFAMWMALVLRHVVTPDRDRSFEVFPNRVLVSMFLLVSILLYITGYKWPAFVYFGLILTFGHCHVRLHKGSNSSSIFSERHWKLIACLVGCFLVCEGLVLGFFYRQVFMVIAISMSAEKTFGEYSRSKQVPIATILLGSAAAIFPMLPTIGPIVNIHFVTASGLITAVVLAIFALFHKDDWWQKLKWTLVSASNVLTAIVTLLVDQSVKSKQGLPFQYQAFSWVTLSAAFLIPGLMAKRSNKSTTSEQLRLLMTCLYLPYLLLSINYEAVFYPIFCAVLLMWRHSVVLKTGFGSNDAHNDPVLCIKMGLEILGLTLYSFFATGNMASLNSFNPSSVQCFLTVFNPFVMGGLMILKMSLPFLLVVSTVRTTGLSNHQLQRVFLAVLFFSDVMAVNFFLLLKDEGSWLDIGTSISHYIISLCCTLILQLFYVISALFIGQVARKEHIV